MFFVSFLIFQYCFIIRSHFIFVPYAGISHYHQGVKQFGSRSGRTFCRAWSGFKLFAKIISRQQKPPLAGRVKCKTTCWYYFLAKTLAKVNFIWLQQIWSQGKPYGSMSVSLPRGFHCQCVVLSLSKVCFVLVYYWFNQGKYWAQWLSW